MTEFNTEQVKIISSAVFKFLVVLLVCLMFGFTLQTCEVDTEKIEACNDACRRGMGSMESGTAYECECAGGGFLENVNPFAL